MPVTIECDGCGKVEKVALQVLDHENPGISTFIKSYCTYCASAIRAIATSVFVPVNETDSY